MSLKGEAEILAFLLKKFAIFTKKCDISLNGLIDDTDFLNDDIELRENIISDLNYIYKSKVIDGSNLKFFSEYDAKFIYNHIYIIPLLLEFENDGRTDGPVGKQFQIYLEQQQTLLKQFTSLL